MRIFSYEELDELGEGLIRQYLGKEAERTCCVDIEGFVTDFLKLPLLYRSFAEEDSDKIGFIADGVTPLRVYEGGTVVRRVYPGERSSSRGQAAKTPRRRRHRFHGNIPQAEPQNPARTCARAGLRRLFPKSIPPCRQIPLPCRRPPLCPPPAAGYSPWKRHFRRNKANPL